MCNTNLMQDTQPRGVVSLIPGSWCKSIPQGTPRMADAVAKTSRSGVISVVIRDIAGSVSH